MRPKVQFDIRRSQLGNPFLRGTTLDNRGGKRPMSIRTPVVELIEPLLPRPGSPAADPLHGLSRSPSRPENALVRQSPGALRPSRQARLAPARRRTPRLGGNRHLGRRGAGLGGCRSGLGLSASQAARGTRRSASRRCQRIDRAANAKLGEVEWIGPRFQGLYPARAANPRQSQGQRNDRQAAYRRRVPREEGRRTGRVGRH